MVPKQKGLLKGIFIARIHPIKNLDLLLQAISSVKSQTELTIIGPVEDGPYWEKCQAMINELPANIKVIYKGALTNPELLPVLQDHHLFILPTKGENFGHSIFESFLAGRPVLISNRTPRLQLERELVGWDLPLDRVEEFTHAIETAADGNQAEFDLWTSAAWRYAKKIIDNPDLKQQYLQLFS